MSGTSSFSFKLPDGRIDKEAMEKIRSICLNAYSLVQNMGNFAKREKESFSCEAMDEEYAQFLCMKTLMFYDCFLQSLNKHKNEVADVLKAVESVLDARNNVLTILDAKRNVRLLNKDTFIFNDIFPYNVTDMNLEINHNVKRNKLSLKRCDKEVHTQDAFPVDESTANGKGIETGIKAEVEEMDVSLESSKAVESPIQFKSDDVPSKMPDDSKDFNTESLVVNYVKTISQLDVYHIVDKSDAVLELNSQNKKHLKKIERHATEVLQALDISTDSELSSESVSDVECTVKVNKAAPVQEKVIIEMDVLLPLSDNANDSDKNSKKDCDTDTNKDSDKESNKECNKEEDYFTKYDLKECSVVLQNYVRLFESDSVNDAAYDSDKEMREILRLTNLSSLQESRKRNLLAEGKPKRKKQKILGPAKDNEETDSLSESQSDGSDSKIFSYSTDIDMTLINAVPTTAEPKVQGLIHTEDVLKSILNQTDDSGGSNGSDDETDVEKDKKKQKTKPTNCSPKGEMLESNVDEEEAKKKKWRQDKMLRSKLPGFSSSDDDDCTEIGVEQPPKPQRRKRKKIIKEDKQSKTSDCDSFIKLSSDLSDFSSDVEFVTSEKMPSSTDIHLVQSDDDDLIAVESKSKVGRKNIRAVQSTKFLEEATRKAAKEEEERTQRLLLKEASLNSAILEGFNNGKGLVLDIDEVTNGPTIVVNEYLTNRLKTHQREGVRFMWNTCYESVKRMQSDDGSGCILAHCMGLGKTFQVITLIHTLFAHPITNTKHVLVVCPLSTVLNWVNEFKIALDNLKENISINRYYLSDSYKNRSVRLKIINLWRANSGVLIMGYETYLSLTKYQNECESKKHYAQILEALIDAGPDLIICDEGHLLKNGENNRTQALMRVKTKRRIILTGTPLQNNLKEYYYMVQFIKPNLLGTQKEYSNRFINPIMNGQYDDSTTYDIHLMRKRSHVLHKLLKGVVQRYEVSELKSYLPEKLDYVLFIPLHPVQIDMYSVYTDAASKTPRLFSDFHYLRYLCAHPYLLHLRDSRPRNKKPKEVDTINLEPAATENNILPTGWWKEKCPKDFEINLEYGPKLKVMLGIIEESIKVNDKLLIFSSSLIVLDAIEHVLQKIGTPSHSKWIPKEDYLRMDGNVSPDVRITYCNLFNNPEEKKLKIFIASTTVGGLGLNLIGANRVILMDVNFNPTCESQSVFRLYRFGQNKRCYVYRLVSMGTMEEVVYERSVTKLAIAGRVVDELQISRHYKSSDLQKMYRFKVYTDKLRPVPKLPVDNLLAYILQTFEKEIFFYHEHQSLLENCPEEKLNENEMILAWDEFNNEKEQNYKRMQDLELKRVQDFEVKRIQDLEMSQAQNTTSAPIKVTNNDNQASGMRNIQHEQSAANIANNSQPNKKLQKFVMIQKKIIQKSIPLKNSTNIAVEHKNSPLEGVTITTHEEQSEVDTRSSKTNQRKQLGKITPAVKLHGIGIGNNVTEIMPTIHAGGQDNTIENISEVFPVEMEFVSVLENVIEID